MRGKRYPKAVREFVDYDYLHLLSEKDLALIEQFSDEFYGATFEADPLHCDVEQRRELARDKNYRREDIMGRGLRRSAEVRDTDAVSSPEADSAVTPEYLNSAAYREALKGFRDSLPKDRREITLPGPSFVAAEARLSVVSGVLPRPYKGVLRMARNRLKKLQFSRDVFFDLGLVVSRHQFNGSEAEAAVRMLEFVTSQVTRLDKKLEAVGIKPPPGRELTKAEPKSE